MMVVLARGAGLILAAACLVSCVGSTSHDDSATVGKSPSSGVASDTMTVSPTRPAPMPSEVSCTQPGTKEELRLGAQVIVEATIVPGRAVTDNLGGSVIPLDVVKVLWTKATVTPKEIVASNVPVEDADFLLGAGRYILLLGSSTKGVYYLAQGREGAFPIVDAEGDKVTRICTVYSLDGTPRPAATAEGSISRQALLEMAISAAAAEQLSTPSPVPVPSPSSTAP